MTGLTDEQYEAETRKVEGRRIVLVETLEGRGVKLKLIHQHNGAIIALCTWQVEVTRKVSREQVLDRVLTPLGLMVGPNSTLVPFVTKLERGRAS